LLARAVQLRPDYYREVISLYLSEVKRLDLARKLAGDDYWRLNDLANFSAQNPAYADTADELHAEATDSLRRRAEAPDAQARELAALAYIDQQQGDFKSAVELYRRALSQEYNRIEWRLSLAQALAAAGQVEDAIHEVRVCLRLRPQHPSATALLQHLSTHSTTE
jgi:tetratricopeptide (TPR) repeat protein